MVDYTKRLGYKLLLGLVGLMIVITVGCQSNQTATPTLVQSVPSSTNTSQAIPIIEPTETSIPLPTNTPTSTPPPTMQTPEEAAETVYATYFEALQQKDFDKAASLLSDYGLQVSGNTREDIVAYFKKQDFGDWELVSYQILDSRLLDDKIALVHNLSKEQTGKNDPEIFDSWGALRLEQGQWRINWNLIVDDLTLNLQSQAVNGVVIKPIQIIRFTNKQRFFLSVENTNQRRVFWGWAGQDIATFHFGSETIAVSGNLKVEPEQTYPSVYVDVEGMYENYPTSIELGNWQWGSKTSSDLPEPGGEKWAYNFEFQTSP